MKNLVKVVVAVALVVTCFGLTSCRGSGSNNPTLTTAH